MDKLISIDDLPDLIKKLREKNKKIATTNGAFDLFHAGHLRSLNFAKSFADILIVGLNSDKSIKEYKSRIRPIIPQEQRIEILCALSCVGYVVVFDEKTPERLLEIIKPDFHIKGSEYKGNIIEEKIVKKYSGQIKFIERTEISTTNIIHKILGEKNEK